MNILEILSREPASLVRIYINTGESFGILSYSRKLESRLKFIGVNVEVVPCGFIEAMLCVYRDSRNNNYSILSLSHGIFAFLNPRKSVFVLHGFPCLSDYNIVRYIGICISYFISQYFSSWVIANSRITKDICQKIFGMKVDSIWNPLVHYFNYTEYTNASPIKKLRAKKRLLAVGRIVPGKRIYEALFAFLSMPELSDWEFVIAGPLFDSRVESLAKSSPNVKCLGAVRSDAVHELFCTATALVSFNELEPFGLVLEEAAFASIAIITTPHSGAVFELKRTFYPYIYCCDPTDNIDICDTFRRCLIDV